MDDLANRYSELRGQADFWLWCAGKQTMSAVAKEIGFASIDSLEANVLELWRQEEVEVPTAVQDLRQFVSGL